MNNQNNILKKIIETGSEISGSISGIVIGGLIAGPPGIIIGGASGPLLTSVFKNIGHEILQRFLGPREEIRIGAVYAFAINKLRENQKNGKLLRNDLFFEEKENNRSDGEEIFEGVVIGAQKEYEERKVKYLGNLYANICSNTQIKRENANQLIKITNSLSYRQLCILQIFMKSGFTEFEEKKKYRNTDKRIKQNDILIEIHDLQQKGLLVLGAVIVSQHDNSFPIIFDDIGISKYGMFFSEMLSLDELPRKELEQLNNEFLKS